MMSAGGEERMSGNGQGGGCPPLVGDTRASIVGTCLHHANPWRSCRLGRHPTGWALATGPLAQGESALDLWTLATYLLGCGSEWL